MLPLYTLKDPFVQAVDSAALFFPHLCQVSLHQKYLDIEAGLDLGGSVCHACSCRLAWAPGQGDWGLGRQAGSFC